MKFPKFLPDGGTIGFVGLVTPHMVRLITGPNHRRLLPASAFGGAIFLMLCDLLARTLFDPRELHSMLTQHLHGGDCWRQIWCVYSFLIWYEQFFGA